MAPNNSKTQRIWARVAGFVYLLLIAVFMWAWSITGGITHGAVGFAQIAARLAASELTYRAALGLQVCGAALTVVLAVALYETLAPAGRGIARLAMCWRLGEAILEGFCCAAGFAVLGLYIAPHTFAGLDPQDAVALLRALQGSALQIVAFFFGLGSILFFVLSIRSRYLPRLISWLGLLASIIVPVQSMAALIIPESTKLFENGWYPILAAELITGFWLLIFAVKATAEAGE